MLSHRYLGLMRQLASTLRHQLIKVLLTSCLGNLRQSLLLPRCLVSDLTQLPSKGSSLFRVAFPPWRHQIAENRNVVRIVLLWIVVQTVEELNCSIDSEEDKEKNHSLNDKAQ